MRFTFFLSIQSFLSLLLVSGCASETSAGTSEELAAGQILPDSQTAYSGGAIAASAKEREPLDIDICVSGEDVDAVEVDLQAYIEEEFERTEDLYGYTVTISNARVSLVCIDTTTEDYEDCVDAVNDAHHDCLWGPDNKKPTGDEIIECTEEYLHAVDDCEYSTVPASALTLTASLSASSDLLSTTGSVTITGRVSDYLIGPQTRVPCAIDLQVSSIDLDNNEWAEDVLEPLLQEELDRSQYCL